MAQKVTLVRGQVAKVITHVMAHPAAKMCGVATVRDVCLYSLIEYDCPVDSETNRGKVCPSPETGVS